ncbi:hypothetical protein DMC30DRAFT_392625 [Rhodotorula diobovata]|uniref:Uncharacterized protein n=1 Tax=Rhodotorula diobovata TaxID=5288 RepID=A0A5C5G1X8_9BASI|nr:hypothetical protein DMC30DRAFT_392625 [Rhodotorula diobovata]
MREWSFGERGPRWRTHVLKLPLAEPRLALHRRRTLLPPFADEHVHQTAELPLVCEVWQLERLFVADRPLQVDQNHVELLNDGLAAVLGGAVVLVWLDARHDAVAEPPVRRLGPLALLVRPIGVVRLAEVLGRRRLSDLEDDPLEAVERRVHEGQRLGEDVPHLDVS